MKATVLYYSHKGKTAGYAREMAMYLWSKGLDVSLSSISDATEEKIKNSDIVLLGCWTCGLFVVGQHPHKKWIEHASSLSGILPGRILLFTTYLIRTGSIFKGMRKAIGRKQDKGIPQLKSKTGKLTQADKDIINRCTYTEWSQKKQ